MGELIQNCHDGKRIQAIEKMLLMKRTALSLQPINLQHCNLSTGARQIAYKNNFNS